MASAAHAAPGDQVSLEIEPGDFGPQKTGITERKTFLVTNDGQDPVTVDPTPVTMIAAPFSPISTTITTTAINPGDRRTITVEYTAGGVSTAGSQGIVFTAISANDPTVSGKFTLLLMGESIATDPASFEVTQPTGGIVDFGRTTVGSSVTQTIAVTNNGVRDLKFESNDIAALGTDGKPIPVTPVGAPFVKGLTPGQSATFEIVFTPTAEGTMTGVIVIQGRFWSGDKVVATATRQLELVGSAVTAPRPSPTPTTPGTAAGGGGSTSNGTTAGGTAGRQLASTGIDGIGGFVGGTLAAMAMLVGTAAVATRSVRRRG